MSRVLIKQAIFMTFRDAVVERSSLDITIKELCRLCDINRNTFYYHFVSLDYLILWGFRKGLSRLLEARFDEDELVCDTGSALDDDWGMAFYVNARNPERDLDLMGFWRTLDELLLGDAEYYRIVFKCQHGAFKPQKHTSAHLMSYLFDIYYRQLYLDLEYASKRNPEVVLEEDDLTLLAAWFTNASISTFVTAANRIELGTLDRKLTMSVFDSRKFKNLNHDVMKLLFCDDTFLEKKGAIDPQSAGAAHPAR